MLPTGAIKHDGFQASAKIRLNAAKIAALEKTVVDNQTKITYKDEVIARLEQKVRDLEKQIERGGAATTAMRERRAT